MSRSRHDLDAARRRRCTSLRGSRDVVEHAVDAEADAHVAAVGSKWMSEAPRSTASEMTRCTSPMTDASSSPEDLTCSSERSYSGPVGATGPEEGGGGASAGASWTSSTIALLLPHLGEPAERALDVVGRRDGGPDLVAGHHRDVVDGEDVAGVGHRHQQGAIVDERDGHGLVALDGGRGDQLGRIWVKAVHLEVEVVEPEALGHRTGDLVLSVSLPSACRTLSALDPGACGVDHRALHVRRRHEAQARR